jgi:hypothetical protein
MMIPTRDKYVPDNAHARDIEIMSGYGHDQSALVELSTKIASVKPSPKPNRRLAQSA